MPDLRLALRIRADVADAQRALRRLESSLGGTARGSASAGRAARGASSGIDAAGRSALRASSGVEALARAATRVDAPLNRASLALGSFRGLLAGIAVARVTAGLGSIPGDIVRIGLAFEALDGRARFAIGSVAGATRELAFVRREANRLGIGLLEAARGYTGLAASARGTTITLTDIRELFLGISESSRVLGLNAGQTSRIFTAFEQVISKGTVSMEELRQQIGEQLPGFLQVAARAMGVTVQRFNEMVEAGEVLASDLIPRVGRALRENVSDQVPAAVGQAAASFTRLSNSITELGAAIGRSGVIDLMAQLAEGAAASIDALRTLGQSGPSDQELPLQSADRLREILAETRQHLVALFESPTARLIRSGEGQLAGFRGRLDREVRETRERIALIRRLIAEAEAPTPTPGSSPAGAEGETPAGERNAARREREAGRRSLQALQGRLRDREARLAGARAQEARLEERSIQAIEELRGRAGVDERARLELLARTRALFAQRRAALEIRLDGEARDRRERAESEELAHQERLEREREELAAKAEREAEEMERARNLALTEIERGLLRLATPYERAIAAIGRWELRARAATERWLGEGEAAEGRYTAIARISAELRAQAAEAEAERRLDAATDAGSGVRRAMRDYVEAAMNAASQVEEAFGRALGGVEDAFVRIVTEGKIEFRSLVDSIVSDLARIVIRRQILAPILGSLGGGGGIFAGLFHRGGIAGAGGAGDAGTPRRAVDPHVFAAAPRLHSGGIAGRDGLAADEVPAILRRGEAVFTPDQLAALVSARGAGDRSPMPPAPAPAQPSIRVEIDNRGRPQEVQQASATADPEQWVIQVVTRDLAEGGAVGRGVQSLIGAGGY